MITNTEHSSNDSQHADLHVASSKIGRPTDFRGLSLQSETKSPCLIPSMVYHCFVVSLSSGGSRHSAWGHITQDIRLGETSLMFHSISRLYLHWRRDQIWWVYVWICFLVIVISKLLKRHSKAKRRAPAYSRALRQIRGVFQRIVRGRLRSGFQKVRGGRLGVKAGVV